MMTSVAAGLAACGAVACVLYLGLHAGKTWLALRVFRRLPRATELPPQVSLSVITPIVGGDPQLTAVLSAQRSQLPAGTRLLWLLDAGDEAGWRAAEQAAAGVHGPAPRLLETVPAPDGCNPKVWKLQSGWEHVDTEYVAVLDDDTTLTHDSLPTAIAALDHCELATGLPCYEPGTGIWSSLVAHFVANNAIATYLATQAWGPPVSLNGMFYVLRTTTLREYDGFAPLAPYVCDDYAQARVVKQHGGRIFQSAVPQRIATTVPSGRAYVRLMHRWFFTALVLVYDQPWRTQAMIGTLLGTPPLLLWCAPLVLAAGVSGAILLVVTLLLRHLLLRVQHEVVLPGHVSISWWQSLASEWLQPLHVLHALASRRFPWRRRTIVARRDGTFHYVESDR